MAAGSLAWFNGESSSLAKYGPAVLMHYVVLIVRLVASVSHGLPADQK